MIIHYHAHLLMKVIGLEQLKPGDKAELTTVFIE